MVQDIKIMSSASSIDDSQAIKSNENMDNLDSKQVDLEYSGSEFDGIDAPTEKELDAVYRHLDYRIIPALWAVYFLVSFGSSAYGNTLTMNDDSGHSLIQTLNLDSHDTSVASALYYVAYIIFDTPMNMIMTKVSPQIWISRIVISDGIVYCCYSAIKSAGGLIGVRFVSGFVSAGLWPALSYYISLWYPSHRTAKRVGYYFTAAQLSASAAGLVSAGFQKMDMARGYEGWKWYMIVYGSCCVFVGILTIWWLPDRPQHLVNLDQFNSKLDKIFPAWFRKATTPTQPLNDHERELHRRDMILRYKKIEWDFRDILEIIKNPRIWPLIMMYFGVVGTGFGLAVFGTTIIKIYKPSLSGIDVSLLYAPIWLFDLGGILTITPFADKYKSYRPVFFCFSTLIIIVGMLVTTYAHGFWNKYAGLLIAGYGLGPTVPITMTWTTEIFGPRHGDVGCAVSVALVSGLGNLGTVMATYALFSGWPADKAREFQYSNMMLVLILGVSIVACIVCVILRYYLGDYNEETPKITEDEE